MCGLFMRVLSCCDLDVAAVGVRRNRITSFDDDWLQ